MATAKQLYYTESLVGKSLLNQNIKDKEDLWDKLDLLPETKLEDLDNKEISQVIKTLTDLNK